MSAFNLFPVVEQVDAPEVSAAKQVMSIGNQAAKTLVQAYLVAYNLVWNNKCASPDKVIASMGKNAKAIFEHAAATAAFLVSQGVTDLPVPPAEWKLVTNADGSMVASK